MTQIMPIALVAAMLATESGLAQHVRVSTNAWVSLMITFGGYLFVILAVVGFTRWKLHGADGGKVRSLITADRALRLGSWLIVIVHAVSVLVFGWLDHVRSIVGDLPGVDELITISIPACGLALLWAAGYSIERRSRNATLIRRMDEGRPIHQMPPRGKYVFQQLRVHLLFLLVPLMLIVTAGELFETLGQRTDERWLKVALVDFGTPASAILIFLFAPLIMRLILDVHRLPEGELRDDLLNVCHANNVKVRELLLWRTDGLMMNAAVMGLIRPLRYVLVTDGLVESMTKRELIAVMAHEVGHVRKHHMPWLLIVLMAIVMIASLGVWLPLAALSQVDVVSSLALQSTEATLTGLAVVGSLIIFGWISRRFERQADTFAVQHLTQQPLVADEPASEHDTVADASNFITPDAAYAMTAALGRVAHMNFVDPDRPSWRHGSIAWRQQYLRSLIGQPLTGLRIDRIVARIKLLALLTVVLVISAEFVWRAASQVGGDTPARDQTVAVQTVQMIERSHP